ncbi:unnamed protein product [Somion occarium]|uniref:Uncharacterized protein n=1 Tax=Somion occarium TaxID=3059160 RepID=A0ABP1D8Q7_9APHY
MQYTLALSETNLRARFAGGFAHMQGSDRWLRSHTRRVRGLFTMQSAVDLVLLRYRADRSLLCFQWLASGDDKLRVCPRLPSLSELQKESFSLCPASRRGRSVSMHREYNETAGTAQSGLSEDGQHENKYRRTTSGDRVELQYGAGLPAAYLYCKNIGGC